MSPSWIQILKLVPDFCHVFFLNACSELIWRKWWTKLSQGSAKNVLFKLIQNFLFTFFLFPIVVYFQLLTYSYGTIIAGVYLFFYSGVSPGRTSEGIGVSSRTHHVSWHEAAQNRYFYISGLKLRVWKLFANSHSHQQYRFLVLFFE